MFTGIIQHVGRVESADATAAGKRLTIELGPLAEGLSPGDSVAVDGACLTAATVRGGAAAFDVIAETLTRTTLGERAGGDKVNLERPLKLQSLLDGHIVQGHIDGVATVQRIDQAGGQCVICLACDKSLTDEMVRKGSIALDGVSLTLVDVADGRFSVALIPATLERTTLGRRRAGGKVNVETDVLGKYVRRLLGEAGLLPARQPLTLERLRQAGFE
jgi:riboflavin synthase